MQLALEELQASRKAVSFSKINRIRNEPVEVVKPMT
jgi:hypothetical protein